MELAYDPATHLLSIYLKYLKILIYKDISEYSKCSFLETETQNSSLLKFLSCFMILLFYYFYEKNKGIGNPLSKSTLK